MKVLQGSKNTNPSTIIYNIGSIPAGINTIDTGELQNPYKMATLNLRAYCITGDVFSPAILSFIKLYDVSTGTFYYISLGGTEAYPSVFSISGSMPDIVFTLSMNNAYVVLVPIPENFRLKLEYTNNFTALIDNVSLFLTGF